MRTTYEIQAADLQEQQVACTQGRVRARHIPAFLTATLSNVTATATQQGLELSGPPYARYHFEDDGTVEIEAGFPVSGIVSRSGDVVPGTLPGGRVVTTLHVGAYVGLGRAYDALETYLLNNGYEPAAAAWESYLDRPDAPEPRTKVYQPARHVSRRHT